MRIATFFIIINFININVSYAQLFGGQIKTKNDNCNQIWSTTNLNVSTYSDGTPIPQVTDQTQWANLTTGAWCYYNNDPANGAIYGKLYNWYAVAGIYDAASLANPTLRKQLAPLGWHIPSEDEWNQYIDCLGGVNIAGGKMKETGFTHWINPNSAATNESGFTGLPGGDRWGNGVFGGQNIGGTIHLTRYGHWWSSTEYSPGAARHYYLSYDNGTVQILGYSLRGGFSVRLLKD
ncbi:MAG: fibrobacter succinogenes major paralogous domain-containing protein [Flavobacterium sp.]|jgi:uncharacterized protein (TIGR02145 family)|nr:fibrobacter succinogenes major paralogous domain-containing protein [Flavobacterium sp.]